MAAAVLPYLSLSSLTKVTSRFAGFLVKIERPRDASYDYVTKKGTSVHQAKFEAVLVSENAEEYCVGFVKGAKGDVASSMDKFREGTVWTLRRVVFESNAQVAYMSSSILISVDLGKSHLSPHSSDTSEDNSFRGRMPRSAVPPRQVAEIALFKTQRSTDLIALVRSVSDVRSTPRGVEVADVELIDDSKAVDGSKATVKLTVWSRVNIDAVKNLVGHPAVFYGIVVSIKESCAVLNLFDKGVVNPAPACAKTTLLQENRLSLVADTNTTKLTKDWVPSSKRKDTSGPQSLSCAAFLGLTSDQPDADMPEVVQLPWLRIDEPAVQDDVQDKSKTRLWYQACCRDVTGSVIIGIPQDLLLILSRVPTMDDFLEKHQDGTLAFPLFCTARVQRSVRGSAGGASQPSGSQGSTDGDGPRYVNLVMCQVAAMPWAAKLSAPNASCIQCLQVLEALPRQEEGLLFAHLDDVHEDSVYGFKVRFGDVEGVKAACVAVLVKCTKTSRCEKIGDDGFKVTTAGVCDAASQDAAKQTNFSVLGFCTANNVLNFKLDPARGSTSRTAVLLISKRVSDVFHVDHLEHVEPQHEEDAQACFRKLRAMSVCLKSGEEMQGRLRVPLSEWHPRPDFSKKCRTLEAMPTDVSFDGMP